MKILKIAITCDSNLILEKDKKNRTDTTNKTPIKDINSFCSKPLEMLAMKIPTKKKQALQKKISCNFTRRLYRGFYNSATEHDALGIIKNRGLAFGDEFHRL